ncbi:MAG: hypothetical protein ACXWDL_01730 [Nocardioides sp.]
MDPLRFLAVTQGFFTRPMAREFGYNSRTFGKVVRSGAWYRFRHGYYTFPDLWAAMSAADQHRTRCLAVLHSLGDKVALSHVSSLVMHGIDPWGQDLTRVHVTRLDGGAGRIEGDVVHHHGLISDDFLVERSGALMTRPDRAALEAASRHGGEAALCLFNQTLHAGLADVDQLWSAFKSMQAWPGMLGVHVPIRMADERVASVGESRGFWLFRTHLIPAPQPQFEVWVDGVLIGTCDWGWPGHGLLGEFDGAIKYGRLLEPGMHPGDVVHAEKQRENALREATDMRMVRLIWSDYARPRLTAQRVERLLRRAA